MTVLELGGVAMPLIEDISIPVNYAIANIRDLGFRDSDHTLHIKIPRTAESDAYFEFIGTPTTSLQTFNPNTRNEAVIKRNDTVILRGNVQLQEVEDDYLTGEGYYITKIIGLNSDLFYCIGEKYLTGNDNSADDLDFSSYDHVLNKANIVATWTGGTAGLGYRYPLADYGYNGSGALGSYTDWYVQHLRAALCAYEILLKIFQDAGKTFTSSFLTGSFFKSLIVPGCKPVVHTLSELADSTCYVGITSSVTKSDAMTHAGAGVWNGPLVSYVVKFDDESSGDFYDSGLLYDPVTGVITAARDGRFTVSTTLFCSVSVVPPSTGDSINSALYDFNIHIQRFISGVWTNVQSYSTPYVGTSATGLIEPQMELIANSSDCLAGDQFRVVAVYQITSAVITNLGSPVTSGSVSQDFTAFSAAAPVTPTGSTFRIAFETDYIGEGETVEMSQILPENFKQKDFVNSIIKMFCLIIMPDPQDPNNYIIEPDPTFYNGTTLDWTTKLDISKKVRVIPTGEFDFKRVLYTHKEDSDYYNKTYQDQYGEVYGTYKAEMETIFPTSEYRVETLFSPTPLVGNDVNALRIPVIYNNNGGTPEPQKFNIRLWIWGGLIDIPSFGTWRLTDSAGTQTFYPDAANLSGGGYPYAGHLDNPYNPTIDLNYDNPREVYWYQATPYVSDNLFTIYHQPMIDEITNKDSKVVKMWFDLNEVDISNLDFRKYIRVHGVKYYLNAVNGYNATDDETTEVELLKLTS